MKKYRWGGSPRLSSVGRERCALTLLWLMCGTLGCEITIRHTFERPSDAGVPSASNSNGGSSNTAGSTSGTSPSSDQSAVGEPGGADGVDDAEPDPSGQGGASGAGQSSGGGHSGGSGNDDAVGSPIGNSGSGGAVSDPQLQADAGELDAASNAPDGSVWVLP